MSIDHRRISLSRGSWGCCEQVKCFWRVGEAETQEAGEALPRDWEFM